jgi:hypothetical protein
MVMVVETLALVAVTEHTLSTAYWALSAISPALRAQRVGSHYSQEGQYQQFGFSVPHRRIYEMMMIRSTELVLIEIMSVTFCYLCNSMCNALHSKLL